MMTNLQKEFFKRLKIPAKEITFDDNSLYKKEENKINIKPIFK